MGLIRAGLALVALGILLSIVSVVGFLPGIPLVAIGVVLIVIGLVVAAVSLPYRMARRV